MSFRNSLFTSESVSAGHPDKVCDQISDAILDEFLQRDPRARVACETFALDGKVIVAGEFRTKDPEHFHAVRDAAVGIVRRTLLDIGYRSDNLGINPNICHVEIDFNHQSAQIAAGVDQGETLGAGDQGMMFGYATDETEALMPLAWSLATDLIAEGSRLRASGDSPLKPDAKSQVTVRYQDGSPIGVQAVVLSWQHRPDESIEDVRAYLLREVIDRIVPAEQRTDDFRIFINPAGAWTIGGPKGDTGLTGRKIIVDTYGGACPHGGGAFSGKDPSKVDRSAAYAARWVAKTVVAAGLAKRCTVQIAYAIGVPEPVSVSVDLHATASVNEAQVTEAIGKVFDLSPAGIIRDLDLLRPIYRGTAALGHFGRWRDPAIHKWEALDRVDALRSAVAESRPIV